MHIINIKIHVFNMITGIAESKILTKYISCKCERKYQKSKRI